MFSTKLLHLFPTPRFLKFSYLGLDITKSSVHYTEIENKGKGLCLGRFGQKNFSPSSDFFSNENLKDVLRAIKKEEKVEYIKFALPEEETYLFNCEVQGENRKEYRSSIEFQLEENVPLSGVDALFDYNVLVDAENNKKLAAVSVVSRQTIARYTDLFEQCGLTPISFVAESNSLSRSIIKKGDTSTSMIVNLSEDRTVCAVVNRGFVQFSSIINTGGHLITEALRKHFDISSADAEKIKEDKGIVKDEKDEGTFSVLANAVSVLRDEIERVTIYWRTHHDQESKWPIEKIYITGKDAAIPGFADYLSASLKTEVHIADVWTNVPRYKEEVPPIHFKDSLSYGTCLGLSLGDAV